jgi:hypothetical protein
MEISRDEVESLIAELLSRDPTFCPKRRNWAQSAEPNHLRARICAAAIVTFLHDCGVRWSRLPAAPCHRTPGE